MVEEKNKPRQPDLPHNIEIRQFIEEVYQEPFSLLANNCLHQSLKLVRKARSLWIEANMVICISKAPKRLWGFIPIVSPHAYAIIDGIKVDVALSPEQEKSMGRILREEFACP